jgi:L-lactate dehydrogenase complex protein LldE
MRVSLFITCLVDLFHPEVGRGMVAVLQHLGMRCELPAGQTCCGQPAFNSGCPEDARTVGRQFLSAFRDAEVIVAPSGSCTAMLRVHLPQLFPKDSQEFKDATSLATRVFEFSEFVVGTLGVTDVGARFPHRVTYHDSCHLLRELGVREQPRVLLREVRGLELADLADSDVCCGFGGTFSIKYPAISGAMGRDKIAAIAASGADYVVANDTGCLMHLRGLLARERVSVRALHLAEILGQTAANV